MLRRKAASPCLRLPAVHPLVLRWIGWVCRPSSSKKDSDAGIRGTHPSAGEAPDAVLTTQGTGDVVPVGASYRLFSITEAAIGFSVVTLALTYFLSVYGAITSRKTFASSLHHRTYGTATAVQFLVGLADEGALPEAGQQLSHLSDFLTETYETHHAYPVLHHFHFREVRYALPQLLLIALDVAALVRTGLDRDRYPGLVRSTAVYQVATAALELLDELQPRAHEDEPPSVATERCWEERFARAVDDLQAAGLHVAPDRQAGARRYLALRRRWDGPLHQLADAMLYDWAEIEPPL